MGVRLLSAVRPSPTPWKETFGGHPQIPGMVLRPLHPARAQAARC